MVLVVGMLKMYTKSPKSQQLNRANLKIKD